MGGSSAAHPADDLEEALRQLGRPVLEERQVGLHSKQPQLSVLLNAVRPCGGPDRTTEAVLSSFLRPMCGVWKLF